MAVSSTSSRETMKIGTQGDTLVIIRDVRKIRLISQAQELDFDTSLMTISEPHIIEVQVVQRTLHLDGPEGVECSLFSAEDERSS